MCPKDQEKKEVENSASLRKLVTDRPKCHVSEFALG